MRRSSCQEVPSRVPSRGAQSDRGRQAGRQDRRAARRVGPDDPQLAEAGPDRPRSSPGPNGPHDHASEHANPHSNEKSPKSQCCTTDNDISTDSITGHRPGSTLQPPPGNRTNHRVRHGRATSDQTFELATLYTASAACFLRRLVDPDVSEDAVQTLSTLPLREQLTDRMCFKLLDSRLRSVE